MSTESFIAAADITNIQAGGSSIFDTATDVLTKGLPAAIVSGYHGILNTGVDLSNKVFGTEIERANTVETLSNVDDSWGDYYKANKQTIDVAGFVAGSFIPGGLAVKGLKAVQSGAVGGSFSRVLGYTTRMEQKYLNKALDELAVEGGSVFTRINSSKAISMGWNVADNVLQAAAFETAAAIGMSSSPMLEGEDIGKVIWDITKTSLLGGAIGGGIGALLTNRLVKDAGKLVEGKQRMYDVLDSIGKTDVAFGDKAFSITDAILKLPKEVTDSTVRLTHNKAGITKELDISKLLDKTTKESARVGLLKLEKELADVVQNDKSVGLPLAASLVGLVRQGLESGASDSMIRKQMGDYLFNLAKVEGIGNRPTNMAGDIMYLDPKGDFTEKNVFTATKQGDDLGYRVVGDQALTKFGTLGKDALTADDAWKKGFDVLIDPASKKLQISPFSSIYQKMSPADAGYSSMFFNTFTKQTSFDTVPTIADMQVAGAELKVSLGGVVSGAKTFSFKAGEFTKPTSAVEATARHIWAASPQVKFFKDVDARDISVLDALLASPEKAYPGIKIIDKEAGTSVAFNDIFGFDAFVFKRKYEMAIELLGAAGNKADLREIAYKLNVTEEWIDNAVSTRFSYQDAFKQGGWQQDANRFLQRENLIMRYDTAAMQKSSESATAISAYHVRVKEAQGRANNSADAVLGQDYAKRLPTLEGSLAKDADSQTVGASMLGASNAGYGDRLRSWAQYVGQQVGNIVNERVSAAMSKLQSPGAKLLQNPTAAAELGAAMTAARLSTDAMSIYKDSLTGKWMMIDLTSFERIKSGGKIEFNKRIDLTDEVGEFLAAHHELHAKRVDSQNVLAAAQGITTNWNPNRLYFPPVDTQRVPFFAFVRQTDGTVFGSSEVAMITARDAAELQAKASKVQAIPGMTVLYKSDTEDYFKAKRDYDYSRSLNAPVIDSTLRKQGLLGDYLPNFTPEAVIEDFVQFTQKAETKLVRDAVSLKYGQTITELNDLSKRYTAGQTSKFEGLTKFLQKGVTDPFDDAVKLALNISKRSEFTTWHQANEFVDALGTNAWRAMEKATLDARGGKISWQEANDQLAKFGMGAHFPDEMAFDVAQTAQDRNLIKTALHKANMLVATGMLRLDFANSLLNIVSTPIMLGAEVSAIRNSIKKDPELFAQFNSMMGERLPGGADLTVPSTTRLLMNAVGAIMGKDSKAFRDRFTEIGTIKGPLSQFHAMMEDISLVPKLVPTEFSKKVENWVEKASSITFNNQAEDATRFVTSHVMWQITEPLVKKGAMSIQEQNAFMTIFTNRVQGNYVASQRPMLFQGTIGAAIGLFQTYQFNLFQQLFRHIENRDLKTIAVMGGMQSSLFGLNGLPLFEAINTQIVGGASINEGHKDAYSFAVQAAGKEWGDWLMYGTASAFPAFSNSAPALWTRGDLNPRSAFIVPTSPMDVPAVAGTLKVIDAVLGMAGQIGKGSSVKDALLFGLEHNGINRPLAGMAQVFSGSSTTTKGNLISAAGDFDSIATASRLLGAKPMDDSIARSTESRSRAYQAMDKEKIDKLGTVVKQKLRDNQPLTEEDWVDLQGQYAASGGRIEGFGQAVRRWDKASNTSVANEVMRHSQRPSGQRMIEAMGGDPLRDYRAAAEIETTSE